MPVTDADELLKELTVYSEAADLQAGHHDKQIPAGKTWTVHRIYRSTTTANSSILLLNRDASTSIRLALNSTSEALVDISGIRIPELWTIRMAQTSDAGDTNRVMSILYEEEDAL